jgi:hypothetical protein
VDETRLIRFERRTAPSRLLFSVWNDRVLNSLRVLVCITSDYPCVKIIDKAKGSAVPIDLPLDQVGVIVDVEE